MNATNPTGQGGTTLMDAGLLKILCCPDTHQPLQLVPPAVVEKLNQQIAARGLRNRGGHEVTEKIDGGLVRGDGKFLYPIRQNVPVLLVDEAIPLQTIS